MSKMSRVAHGRACRQEEMGVGCAHGPIYLCQVWPSGRRAPWRPLRQKRELAATRNCRWRFLELIRLRVRPKTSGVERVNLPGWRSKSLSPKCQQQAHLSRHCERGRANARPMAGSANQSNEGGKADCFVATL